MTREVVIGEQIVKLRATARLPVAYRALHNRDLLRDMDAWREKLKAMLDERENADVPVDTPEASADAQKVSADAQEASGQTDAETETDSGDASPDNAEILYTMNLDLVARLAYAMAKSAEPSVPDSVEEWLDALESPNALYILTGEVLTLYNNGFETTAEAKKISRHDAENNDRAVYAPHSAIRLIYGKPRRDDAGNAF